MHQMFLIVSSSSDKRTITPAIILSVFILSVSIIDIYVQVSAFLIFDYDSDDFACSERLRLFNTSMLTAGEPRVD